MTDLPTPYTEHFIIRASEVDTTGQLTVASLCALFQEVAGNNAKELQFDITDLKEDALTWVLHRMDIRVHRYPKWREEIIIETWPAAGDALRAYRNYRVLDENGEEVAVCLSYWMMINLEPRRPVRIPQAVLDKRLPDIPHVLVVKSDRLRSPSEAEPAGSFQVRRSDLDMNNHTNNARYVEWLMEALTPEEASSVKTLDIVFQRETRVGDQVISRLFRDDSSFIMELTDTDGNTVVLGKAEV
jgi:acyl-ACP thioesterase